MSNTDFPTGIDQGGTHAIGAIYADPITGRNYAYRGGGRWDIVTTSGGQSLDNYYTKTEIDAFNAASAVLIEANSTAIAQTDITAQTALIVGQEAIPAIQKALPNGVATLDGTGKVPNAQLPDAIVSGVPSWDEITDKPASFTPSTHTHVQADIDGLVAALAAKLNTSSYTAADVLQKLLTVDGPGTGLDADLLDGRHSADFSLAGHDHTGIYSPVSHTHTQYFEVDTNTSPIATNYKIGQYLVGIEPDSAVLLNASMTLYVDNNDGGSDPDYQRAVTPVATNNTVLTGTWRFRGRASGGAALYQRVL